MKDLTGLSLRVEEFEAFVREVEPRLRRGLVAARGPIVSTHVLRALARLRTELEVTADG